MSLFPQREDYSLVIIDTWNPDVNDSAVKLMEVSKEGLQKALNEVEQILSDGEYLMIYDRQGMTVNK